MPGSNRTRVQENLNNVRRYVSLFTKEKRDSTVQALLVALDNSNTLIPDTVEEVAPLTLTESILRSILTSEEDDEVLKKNRERLINLCMGVVRRETPPKSSATFRTLPDDMLLEISTYNNAPPANMQEINPRMHTLFREAGISTSDLRLHWAVMWSNVDGPVAGGVVKHKIKDILRKRPSLLTKRQTVTKQGIQSQIDPAKTLYEQTYFDVSPIELAVFNGDMYVLNQLYDCITAGIIPEDVMKEAYAQMSVLTQSPGGSNAVNIGPVTLPATESRLAYTKGFYELTYDELTCFIEKDKEGRPKTYWDMKRNQIRWEMYTLQESQDAIVLYENHYYWVVLNHNTAVEEEKIVNREPILFKTPEAKQTLAQWFDNHEMNSGFTLSHKQRYHLLEHATSTSNPNGIILSQNGIHYRCNGEDYTDTKAQSYAQWGLRKYRRVCTESTVENIDQPSQLKDNAWIEYGAMLGLSTPETLLLLCTGISLDYIEELFTVEPDKRTFRALSCMTKCPIYRLDFKIVLGENCSITAGVCGPWHGGRWIIPAQRDSFSFSDTYLDLLKICRYDEGRKEFIAEFKLVFAAQLETYLPKPN